MIFKIADIHVKLQLPERYFPRLKVFKKIVKDYGAPPESSYDFEVVVEGNEEKKPAKLPVAPQFYAVKNSHKTHCSIFGRTSAGRIVWPENKILVSFYANTYECPNTDQLGLVIFDFLKIVFSLLVLKKGGLPMHSSSVCENNEALVFYGPSEAGKSTIAALLAPKWSLLNDELNFILPENHSFRVYSTPFSAPMNYSKCSKDSARLKRLFCLEKSACNKIGDLSSAQKILSLISSIYSIPVNDFFCKRMFDNADEICKRVPVQKLFFKNDPTIASDLNSLLE